MGGTAVLLAVTLAGGLFVVRGGVKEPASAEDTQAVADAKPVTDEMLLTMPQVQRLTPREPWRLVGTSDNTSGNGINSVCQGQRPGVGGEGGRLGHAPIQATARFPAVTPLRPPCDTSRTGAPPPRWSPETRRQRQAQLLRVSAVASRR